MSRSYRIRIRETLRRVIRASDHVSSELELLEILPPQQMAELLAAELLARGFKRQGKHVVRVEGDTTVLVDLEAGTVTVQAKSDQQINLSQEQQARVYDDAGPNEQAVRGQVREQLRKKMEGEAAERAAALQKQVTDRLEGQLADLKRELDQAVNRATAAALKQKASQIGHIKSMNEEPNGSLTIVVEV